METSEYLFKKAVELGLCQEWKSGWKDDLDSLLTMYKKGIDFCIEHDYPNLDFVRKNLSGKTEHKDIYIDAEKTIEAYKETIICLGNCKMTFEVKPYAVVRIYVLHNSEIKINVSEGAILMIDAYDNSHVAVTGYADKTKAYRYDNSEIIGVRFFSKERRVKSTFKR